MPKYSLTLSFALCLLSYPLAAHIAQVKPNQRDSKLTQSDSDRAKSNDTAFRVEQKGDGVTEDGARMYYTKYQASHGTTLYETWVDFDSPTRAAKQIRDLVSDPIKNLRDVAEFDEKGQEIGRRILVVRHDKKRDMTEAILAWNHGPQYQEIRSTSLEDVLAFERQFRPAKGATH
jgi:hypothetical protein